MLAALGPAGRGGGRVGIGLCRPRTTFPTPSSCWNWSATAGPSRGPVPRGWLRWPPVAAARRSRPGRSAAAAGLAAGRPVRPWRRRSRGPPAGPTGRCRRRCRWPGGGLAGARPAGRAVRRHRPGRRAGGPGAGAAAGRCQRAEPAALYLGAVAYPQLGEPPGGGDPPRPPGTEAGRYAGACPGARPKCATTWPTATTRPGSASRRAGSAARPWTIARQSGDAITLAHAYTVQGIILDALGDKAAEKDSLQSALDHARRAGAKYEESLYLANLADHFLKAGDYATALRHAQAALPLTRELKNLGGETVALANIGLAQIALHDIEAGKRHLRASIDIDERRGSITGVSDSYAEMGQYLERAGDAQGAIEAWHQHRALAGQILARDQQQAILEIQEQFDAERRDARAGAAAARRRDQDRGAARARAAAAPGLAGRGQRCAGGGGGADRRAACAPGQPAAGAQQCPAAVPGRDRPAHRAGQPPPPAGGDAPARRRRQLHRHRVPGRPGPLQAHQRLPWPCRRRRRAGRGGAAPAQRAARRRPDRALGRRGVPGDRARARCRRGAGAGAAHARRHRRHALRA